MIFHTRPHTPHAPSFYLRRITSHIEPSFIFFYRSHSRFIHHGNTSENRQAFKIWCPLAVSGLTVLIVSRSGSSVQGDRTPARDGSSSPKQSSETICSSPLSTPFNTPLIPFSSASSVPRLRTLSFSSQINESEYPSLNFQCTMIGGGMGGMGERTAMLKSSTWATANGEIGSGREGSLHAAVLFPGHRKPYWKESSLQGCFTCGGRSTTLPAGSASPVPSGSQIYCI